MAEPAAVCKRLDRSPAYSRLKLDGPPVTDQNECMNRDRLLIPLFVVAMLLASGCCVLRARSDQHDALAAICALTQTGLAAIWLGSGHGNLLIRGFVATAILLLWSPLLQGSICFHFQMAFVACVLGMARLASIRIIKIDSLGHYRQECLAKPQFTLGRLFAFILLFSILLTHARSSLVIAIERPAEIAYGVIFFSIFGAIFGLPSLFIVSVVLSRGLAIGRWLLLVALLAMLAFLATTNSSVTAFLGDDLPAGMLTHCALIAASLAVFRVCGYRLGRVPVSNEDVPPAIVQVG